MPRRVLRKYHVMDNKQNYYKWSPLDAALVLEEIHGGRRIYILLSRSPTLAN